MEFRSQIGVHRHCSSVDLPRHGTKLANGVIAGPKHPLEALSLDDAAVPLKVDSEADVQAE